MPDLNNLFEDDLKRSVDFKNVYATILKNWLKTNDELILKGSFKPLSFIVKK